MKKIAELGIGQELVRVVNENIFYKELKALIYGERSVTFPMCLLVAWFTFYKDMNRLQVTDACSPKPLNKQALNILALSQTANLSHET